MLARDGPVGVGGVGVPLSEIKRLDIANEAPSGLNPKLVPALAPDNVITKVLLEPRAWGVPEPGVEIGTFKLFLIIYS